MGLDEPQQGEHGARGSATGEDEGHGHHFVPQAREGNAVPTRGATITNESLI